MTEPAVLGLAGDPARYGNKAAALARVGARVRVPAGLVLPGGWLLAGLAEPDRAELTDRLGELLRCPAAELAELLAGIAATAGRIRLADRIATVTDQLGRLGPMLVVRSSSADEDGTVLSFAGVFDSIVDVDSPLFVDDPGAGEQTPLAAAVRQVWVSGLSAKALLHYRRLGRIPRPDHLSVLIQRAIRPRVAGVAFSEPSGAAYLEWTAGHGAELVGGLAVPTRERLGGGELAGWRGELRSALAELAQDGTGHDVEWAWDGEQLWVVQVRPRTAGLGSSERPGLRIAPLYEGDAHDLVLGQCAGEYTRIRGKRRLPRAIAIARGARVPAGWLVNWDPDAPADPLAGWSSQLPERVVLDFSPDERQHIVRSAELPAAVRRLAAAADGAELAFLCREYLHGELALLSTMAADGSVYLEASADGLLALNRGFSSARPLAEAQLRELVGAEQAAVLHETTREHARLLHPRAVLEWVISDGTLYFIDYSAPADSANADPAGTANASSAGPANADPAGTASADPAGDRQLPARPNVRVLSPGTARGRVQRLDIDELLTESSIAPIISIAQPVAADHEAALLSQLRDRLDLTGEPVIVAAARPIAVLSMLIGVAAGFLFEEGALLSHLGILLREAGAPAAILGTGNLPPAGTLVELVHGTVIPLPDAAGKPRCSGGSAGS
ncbi:MAG TPA: PEP/pyruvate-binding domain-containing protein [Jatrophihabitans sp.]|nr:PEP/pyruvate-binding domain-containing protein [Jatrophihabitans sp.]